jgi:hypothetical protein
MSSGAYAGAQAGRIAYSVGTLVTDPAQYRVMQASFEAKGFTDRDCEFLHIDNSARNNVDAYTGLNQLLNRARGRYAILCHQDVRLHDDDRAKLDATLAALQQHDPTWALVGNAGGVGPGRLALRITDPHGTDTRLGTFPVKVSTLDENFIVVKQSARLSFSRDLSGFHFYGADICLVAEILGYSAYVIDFHLEHLSAGNSSADFILARSEFQAKWSHALRPRWLQTTCALVPVSGSYFGKSIGPVAARLLGRTVNLWRAGPSAAWLRTSAGRPEGRR